MIDFRYHLISIVAVLLALAIGIFAGSGFLGGPLLDDLRNRVKDVKRSNEQVRAQNADLHAELRQADDFTKAIEPLLVGDALSGDHVVIFQFEGTESGLIDELQAEIEGSGGVVPARITLSDKLALEQTTDRDQLALIVRSAEAKPGEIRRDAAEAIGSAAASAGAFAGGDQRGASARAERFRALLDELSRAGFVSVDQIDGNEAVPPGSDFVIAGGSPDPAPYDVAGFAAALGRALATSTNAAVLAESSNSVWGLSAAIRDDTTTSDIVATSDGAETLTGRIATVLALVAAQHGDVGHYGTGPGADGLVPTPSPGA